MAVGQERYFEQGSAEEFFQYGDAKEMDVLRGFERGLIVPLGVGLALAVLNLWLMREARRPRPEAEKNRIQMPPGILFIPVLCLVMATFLFGTIFWYTDHPSGRDPTVIALVGGCAFSAGGLFLVVWYYRFRQIVSDKGILLGRIIGKPRFLAWSQVTKIWFDKQGHYITIESTADWKGRVDARAVGMQACAKTILAAVPISVITPDALSILRSHTSAISSQFGSSRARELPFLLLMAGIFFGVVGLLSLIGKGYHIPYRDSLLQLSGRFENQNFETDSRGAVKMNVFIRDSHDELRHLSQVDLRSEVPTLADLHVGDDVKALVEPYFLQHDIDMLWQLSRNDVPVLSYEATKLHFWKLDIRIVILRLLFPLAIIGTSVLLRLRYGAWGAPSTQKISQLTK